MKKIFLLHDNWQFKLNALSSAVIPEELKGKLKNWYNAEIPGTIHTDLFKAGLIPDPFFSDNELTLQWIGKADWNYQVSFDIPDDFDKNKKIILVFDGIDTIVDIFLNGKNIAATSNMFLQYKFDISDLVKKSGNLLEVKLLSPLNIAQTLENKYGKLPVALNSERVYIRKAQYSFGWDWGPSFPTSGLWRYVYLAQNSNICIENILFNTNSVNSKSANAEVKIRLNRKSKSKLKVHVQMEGENSYSETLGIIHDSDYVNVKLKIKNPLIWFPNNLGEQHLYKLTARLFEDDELIDEEFRKVGIRTCELQLKDKNKSTFRFVVNGKPIFAKGANWIPADSFLPRVTEEKYRNLLLAAKDANMNMLRIWGGGVYENEIFYNLCDELGILIWHDFMFACGCYPETKKFINNVKAEVKQNAERLQYHPSIALWCGNNENEWIWYQEQNQSYKKMPGYKIYNSIIPDILDEIDPFRPYWQSSPFIDETGISKRNDAVDPNSQLSGNRHQWNLWSKWIDYDEVKHDTSLFVTEFGFQGPANINTLNKVIPENERKISSQIFELHNKQVEGTERVIKFLSSHLPLKTEWNDFIYLAQLNQAFALKTCLEHWLSRFPETNGSIIWQLNDCWQVTSWSLIDYELDPKLSYHFVKNIFSDPGLFFINDSLIRVMNNSSKDFKGFVNFKCIESASGNSLFEQSIKLNLSSFNSKEIEFSFSKKLPEDRNWILIGDLYNNSVRQKRTFLTGKKWKYLKFADPNIKIDLSSEDGRTFLNLTSDKPAFFIDIYHSQISFSERGFILLPGEKVKLIIPNTNMTVYKEDFRIFNLNEYCGL